MRQNKLGDHEIHVWVADLRLYDGVVSSMKSILSSEERGRADRFHFPRDQNRYISARAILRSILGAYLNVPPPALSFRYSESGKPFLSQPFHESDLQFNVSHSGDFALYAIAKSVRVGIDIEKVRNDVHCFELASRFFSKTEIAALQSCDETARVDAFFRCWTRKEAYVKALGDGLSMPLDQFTVSFLPGELPCVKEEPEWMMHDLSIHPLYAAAVVTAGRVPSLTVLAFQNTFSNPGTGAV